MRKTAGSKPWNRARQSRSSHTTKCSRPCSLSCWAKSSFRPYVVNNVTSYTAFELWKGARTSLGFYCIMHGQFLSLGDSGTGARTCDVPALLENARCRHPAPAVWVGAPGDGRAMARSALHRRTDRVGRDPVGGSRRRSWCSIRAVRHATACCGCGSARR